MRFVWRPPGLGLGIILILFKGVFKSNQIFPQWQWRGWFQLKTTGCSLLASKKCQECTVIASVSGDIAPASCSRQQNFHNIQRWWCRQVCQFQQVDSLCLKVKGLFAFSTVSKFYRLEGAFCKYCKIFLEISLTHLLSKWQSRLLAGCRIPANLAASSVSVSANSPHLCPCCWPNTLTQWCSVLSSYNHNHGKGPTGNHGK